MRPTTGRRTTTAAGWACRRAAPVGPGFGSDRGVAVLGDRVGEPRVLPGSVDPAASVPGGTAAGTAS
jgi:hypothetical protein